MKQKIKDALTWLDKKEREHFAEIALLKGFAFDGKKYETPEEFKTIRRALLIADKLMQEPSHGMMLYKATCQHHAPYDMSCVARSNRMRIFKAMRDQLLKEVDDE